MPVLRNETTVPHKLIVACDFGTTFSGVSYVTTNQTDIQFIERWPGNHHPTWKAPSRFAYASENESLRSNKWGFLATSHYKSYSWTKLLLDSNAAEGQYDDPALANMLSSGVMQLPEFRNASGVCEDYLKEVYNHFSRKVREDMTNLTFDSTRMECWITLPAIWSDEAKDATLRAAKNAGFGSRPGDETFTITEPEAAAIATLKHYSSINTENPTSIGETVMVVDCGGGTTDITTYVIRKLSPKLEFDELLVGDGGKCGSTYIDRNLEALLTERYGSNFTDIPFLRRGTGSQFMDCFEKFKQQFGSDDDDEELRTIGPLNMNLPDSESYDGFDHTINLSSSEDMECLFDPVVEKIKNLLHEQVDRAWRTKRARIDRIILVGGFAESPYLFKSLKQWCWENGDPTLMRPQDPQNAVLKGAALRGLEGISPRITHVRRHYGFSITLKFREGIDPESKAWIDPYDDGKYCEGRMAWMISMGDEIVEGIFRTKSCANFYQPGQENINLVELYSSQEDIQPEYIDDPGVDRVGTIRSPFPANFNFGQSASSRFNPRLGQTFHKFFFDVKVIFGHRGSNLVYETLVNGNVRSTTAIEF